MSNSMIPAVKSYLGRTNRPYSANDVFNNLNTNDNKVSKTGVTRALEELAANNVIKEKINGKQKVYFADQNQFNHIDNSSLQQIDQQLDQLTQQFKQVEKELKLKDSKLSSAKSSLTSEQLSQQLFQLNGEIKELQNRLEVIDSKAKDFDPQINDQIKNKRKIVVTEWRKRKRMAIDMIDIIQEKSEKSKTALIEEIGVETDEDVNAILPQI